MCRCMSCRPGGSAAGRSAGSRRCGAVDRRARRRRKRLYREHRARRGGRLRRLSGVPGLAGGSARCASRPCSTNRMRCSAGSTACSPASRRRSPPLTTEVERLKPRYTAQDRAGRQSGARGGRAAGRDAVPAVRRASRRSRSWSPAEARARRVLGEVVPEGLGLLDAVAAPPAAGRPAMPRRRHRAGARSAMPSSAFRPS